MEQSTGRSQRGDRLVLLEQLGAELARLSAPQEIAEHALEWLGGQLGLRWAALTLDLATPPAVYYWGDLPGDPLLPTAGSGLARRLAAADAAAHLLPLVATGITIGELVVGARREGRQVQHALLGAATPLVAVALQGAALLAELERQSAILSEREGALEALATRLLKAQDEERIRLAQDLHDDALQRVLLLARTMGEGPDAAHARWRAALDDIATSLRATCGGLRPRILDDFGLVAALEWLVNDVRTRADFAVYLVAEAGDGTPIGRLPPALELQLFRVAQEALNNCMKHAHARLVVVTLWRDGCSLRLSVSDDGCGPPGGALEQATPLGLLGMRARLRPWRGLVSLEPGAGRGAVLTAAVTLEESDGEHS